MLFTGAGTSCTQPDGSDGRALLAPGSSSASKAKNGSKRALKLACCHKSGGPNAPSLKSPVHIHPTLTHGFTRQPSRTFFTSAPHALRPFPSSHPSPLIFPRTLSGTVHLFNTLAFLLRCDTRGVVANLTVSLHRIAESLLLLLACA